MSIENEEMTITEAKRLLAIPIAEHTEEEKKLLKTAVRTLAASAFKVPEL